MSITPQEQRVTEEPSAGSSVEVVAGKYGLLANGSSRLWDVAVDESLEREGEWYLELDGATIYLVFQLRNLAVIPKVIALLQRALNTPCAPDRRRGTADDPALILGNFSTSTVSLMQDDESPPRCFLVVGSDATSAMRLTLLRDDVEMLLQALHQVAEQLPDEAN